MDNVILSPHSGSYGIGAKKTQINAVSTLVPTAVTQKTMQARNVANRKVIEIIKGIEFT